MCDQSPQDNLKWVKKNKSLSHTLPQSLCSPSRAFPPHFSAVLQLLCGIRLATLASALSPDSSLGSQSPSVGNSRSCLKCNPGTEPYQMPGMPQMPQIGSKTSKLPYECFRHLWATIFSSIHLSHLIHSQDHQGWSLSRHKLWGKGW